MSGGHSHCELDLRVQSSGLHHGKPALRQELRSDCLATANLWKHRKTHQQQHQAAVRQQLAEAEAAVGLAVMETAVEALPLVEAIEIYPLAEAEGVQISG